MGGVLGKQLFNFIRDSATSRNMVGAVQSAVLALITVGTLVYTLNKSKIKTKHIKNTAGCFAIGMALGIISSFLGIGGGPINLVVLYFFFSMDTKTAAANSLYIILFSQLTSVVSTFVAGLPRFETIPLLFMMAGGVSGGIAGRKLSARMDNKAVDRLFICLMVFIIIINIYNAWQYLSVSGYIPVAKNDFIVAFVK